jgi:uncharacterized membrane protein YgdD (TMEM256/DUF423 family)
MNFAFAGAVSGLVAVALGAFAAHGLCHPNVGAPERCHNVTDQSAPS